MSKYPKSWTFDEIKIGQIARMKRKVLHSDIVKFSEVSGDKNPVHLDAEFARKTIFKEPIAHGLLSASYFSALFGVELPGPGAIYVEQTLRFIGPVKPGDTVHARVMAIAKFPPKRRVRFACRCSVRGRPVLEGLALLQVPA